MSLDGIWSCQRCGRPTLRPIDAHDAPTCGQRETLYCPLCESAETFQFGEAVRDAAHAEWVRERQLRCGGVVDGIRGSASQSHAQPSAARAFDVPTGHVRLVPTLTVGLLPTCAGKDNSAIRDDTLLTSSRAPSEGLPLLASTDEVEAFLAARCPTEEDLRALRHYLQGTVLPCIDKVSRERSMCPICMERPRAAIVLPCKHRCACVECLATIRYKAAAGGAQCPLCRGPIADFIVPYE